MKQSEMRSVLGKCFAHSKPIMIEGAPGVGKTAIVTQAAQDAGMDLIVSHPITCDPTDAGGILWPDVASGKAVTLPKEDLARALSAKEPLVWFLDDFAQAAPSVQNSFAHLIHARQSGPHKLPDHVVFAIACNRRTDRAGSHTVVSTILSRCLSSITLVPSCDEWITWALGAGVHPAIISYLRQRPDSLYTDTPPNGEAYPCPRSWQHASEVLSLEFNLSAETELLAGAVGHGAAVELAASAMMLREKIDARKALDDPRYKLPKRPDQVCALVCAAAYYAEGREREVFALATRMAKENLAEYAGMLVADTVKRSPAITQTAMWTTFALSPVGDLIRGVV